MNKINYWRIRTNQEIDELISEENTVRLTKSWRSVWAGHVKRMPKKNMRILDGQIGVRKRERPRKRWMQKLEEDLKKTSLTK